ncbi:MAG: phosphatidate phosphatase APP1 [Candidatus Promineifilaceae bacterium]|jgi:phosphatidate phosphatase APP1
MKKIITKITYAAENRFDALTQDLSDRLMADGRVHIHPYRGFGNQDKIFLRGRVLRDKQIPKAQDEDNFVKNLLHVWQHITSDELPNVRVLAEIGGLKKVFTTDEEGYFVVEMENPGLPADRIWHKIKLELIDRPDDPPVTAFGEIIVPLKGPAGAQFGIISDIDDTVLQSKATNYLAAASLMFFKNAKTRLPFDGVAELYQALHNKEKNPIFFVSSSPWNLHDLLTDFFKYQAIPKAPLFLVDYGFSADQFIKPGHGEHKLHQIEMILAMYPHLNFILMGDSGQHDPEIYRQVIDQNPGRILAAYIRDVTNEPRDHEVLQIAAEVTASGTDMLLASDSAIIESHAKTREWV